MVDYLDPEKTPEHQAASEPLPWDKVTEVYERGDDWTGDNTRWRMDFNLLLPTDTESNLTRHAVQQLAEAGLFDEDSDYKGMIGSAVMDLIKLFAHQGHSGFSANMVSELFWRLSKYENIVKEPA